MCRRNRTIWSVCGHSYTVTEPCPIEEAKFAGLQLGWEYKDKRLGDYQHQYDAHHEHGHKHLHLFKSLCGHKESPLIVPLPVCQVIQTHSIIHGFCNACVDILSRFNPQYNHKKAILQYWQLSAKKYQRPVPADEISLPDLRKSNIDPVEQADFEPGEELIAIADAITGFCDLRPDLLQPNGLIRYLYNVRKGTLACAANNSPPEIPTPPPENSPTAALTMAYGKSDPKGYVHRFSSLLEDEPARQNYQEDPDTLKLLCGDRKPMPIALRRRDQILSLRSSAKATDSSVLAKQGQTRTIVSGKPDEYAGTLQAIQSNHATFTDDQSRFTGYSIADAAPDDDVDAYKSSGSFSWQSSCFDDTSPSSAASTRPSTPGSVDFSAFAKDGEDGNIYLVPAESPLPSMGSIVKEVLSPVQSGQTLERAAKTYVAEGCAQHYCRQFGVAQPPELF